MVGAGHSAPVAAPGTRYNSLVIQMRRLYSTPTFEPEKCDVNMFLTALCAATLLVSRAAHVSAFYLPGAAPRNYVAGERVDVLVNALTPTLGTKDNSKLVRVNIVL